MKWLSFFVACAMLFSVVIPASADPVDLSGMSFDELVALREQLNLAIWNSQEWQEISVPAGTYKIGEDIPVGHWVITPQGDYGSCNVYYFQRLDYTGNFINYNFPCAFQYICSKALATYEPSLVSSIDYNMQNNWYFKCEGSVIFTPYTGKPDLGFK